jgi:hypothetical protein
MLLVTAIVTSDELPANKALLEEATDDIEVSDASRSFKAALNGLLKLEVHSGMPESPPEATAMLEVSGFPQVFVTATWRVDLLQKLYRTLPSSVDAALAHCTPVEALRLIEAVQALLTGSGCFLGKALSGELLALLVPTAASDNLQIATIAMGTLHHLRYVPGNYGPFNIWLCARFVADLEVCARTRGSWTVAACQHTLKSMLGTVGALGGGTSSALRTCRGGSGAVVASICELLSADEGIGGYSMVLETRRYGGSTGVDCGYFRQPMKYLRSEEAMRCARSLFLLLGHAGLSDEVLGCATSLSRTAMTGDKEDGALMFEFASWNALRHTLPGLFYLAQCKKASIAKVDASCVVCGSRAGLSVCTGCRVVWYCGRMHQREHWAVHRAECKSSDTRTPSHPCPDPESLSLHAYCRVADPVAMFSLRAVAVSVLDFLKACSAADLKSHSPLRVFSCAAAIEVLATSAQLLGPEFRRLLPRALYPLLEAAQGDNDPVIRVAAQSTLARVGKLIALQRFSSI